MKQLKINNRITNRDSYSIDRYLYDISKYTLLSEDEEVSLARRIKQGDQAALDELVKSNLRFVVSVAKQYQNQGLPLSDLINEGNVGLIKAATKFDETRGFKFISYAVWWIRQSILHALVCQSKLIRLPLNKVAETNKIRKLSDEFEQEHDREPTSLEMAELSNMTVSNVEDIAKYSQSVLSIDQSINDEDDDTFENSIADKSTKSPDAHLEEESLKIQLGDILNVLTKRELTILEYSFGINNKSKIYSLDEIGNKLELTRERVRQLKNRSIRKLRFSLRNVELRPFLG